MLGMSNICLMNGRMCGGSNLITLSIDFQPFDSTNKQHDPFTNLFKQKNDPFQILWIVSCQSVV